MMDDTRFISPDELIGSINTYNQIVTEYGLESDDAVKFYNAQQQLLKDYAAGNIKIAPNAFAAMVDYIKMFGGHFNEQENSMAWNANGAAAFMRLERDLNEMEREIAERGGEKDNAKNTPDNNMDNADIAPVSEILDDVHAEMAKMRIRSPYSDMNQYMLDRVAADVYLDMGIITEEQHAKSSETETIDVLGKIPDLKGEKAIEFSERFVDRLVSNTELFNLLPPTTLANAYIGTKDRITADDGANKDVLNNRLDKIAARIDDLTGQFANNSGYFFADVTNIADAYDGYNKMFDARRADLDENQDTDKIAQIDSNKQKLEEFIIEYDQQWGLGEIKPEDAAKLSRRWDDLVSRVGKVKLSDDVLKLAAKYSFLDEDGNVIPQFVDARGRATNEYKPGYKLDKNGRLNRVIDLARHDVAMRNLAAVNEPIDDKKIAADVNDRIPFKLFEIDTADKIVQGAMEDPHRFTDPEFLKHFVSYLENYGGEISDNGYQAAMDAQVNQTAGFAARLKSKLKNGATKVGGLFGKIFKPIRDIDKRRDDRFEKSSAPVDKRAKRIEMFVRILKGFGSAFLVSAAITTIATAAAATAGVSLAASLATIGVVTGIGMGAWQIHKWRERQRAAGRPDGIRELLRDKRMMSTLGTTGLASIAMIFGAAGLTHAALAMGYGAMALGGTSNAIQMYKDAKNSGMGTKESLVWAFANAAAIVAGGVLGRTTAKVGIQAFNEHNPHNTLFQTRDVVSDVQQVERQESHTVYTDDAIQNAKRIAEMWYADNPTELQHRVDMINAYNAEHGTTINPYRAIILSADAGGQTFDNMALHVDGGGVVHSGGQHTVLTDFWGAEHGVSSDELSALRNMFADGVISADEIAAASKVDAMVSSINEVGTVTAGDAPHYDGVLPQNTVDANGRPVFNTYADGNSVFHSQVVTVIDDVPVNVETFTPVDIPFGLGMFGVSYPRTNREFDQLKDRAGALMDRLDTVKSNENTDDDKVLPTQKEPKMLAPHDDKELPPHSGKNVLPGAGQKAVSGHAKPKMLPAHVDDGKELAPHDGGGKRLAPHVDEKQLAPVENVAARPTVLKITRAQARNLDLLEQQIADIESKRTSGMKKSDAEKLHKKQKTLQQKLQTLLNQLGRPSDDELAAAKADAYRRYDLKNAIDELAKIDEQIAGYNAHKSNRSKKEGEELARRRQQILARIAELGGAESLDDVSYLRDPVPVEPEYPAADKDEKPTKKKSGVKNWFRRGMDVVRDIASNQFGVGADFDDEMMRQSAARDALDDEYRADIREQNKRRRRNVQNGVGANLRGRGNGGR